MWRNTRATGICGRGQWDLTWSRMFSPHHTFVTVARMKKANENRLVNKKMKSQKKGDRKSGKNVDY